MSSLHFAFLTTFYPPYHFGGDGIAVERWAHGLVRHGHRVTVIHDADGFFALGGRAPDLAPSLPEGLRIVTLKSRFSKASAFLTQQLGTPIVHGRRLRAILADPSFDVLQFHNISLLGGPGLLRMGDALKLHMAHDHWLVCPSHVLWRHGREPCPARQCLRCVLHHRRPPQAWRYTGKLDRALREVDAFLAMSEFSRAKHQEFGLSRDMEVVANFLPDRVPADRPPITAAGRPWFLIAGRLELIKGIDRVLPLFREDFGADLVIAGDGSERERLEAEAAGLRNVRFLGRLSADELSPWFGGARGVIVPSLGFETFGMTIIEAFRAGAPVIARRMGPAEEILAESQAGLLFADEAELKSALRRLTEDATLAEDLRRKGTALFDRQYSESAVIPRYLEIVRSTAERRGNRRILAALTALPISERP